MPALSSAMIRAIGKIICDVLLDCFSMPLSRKRIASVCGLGTSCVEIIHGPIGQVSSRDFPLNHCPCERCRSRAVISLRQVYPKMTSCAFVSLTSRQRCPITTASSASKSYSGEMRACKCNIASGAIIAVGAFVKNVGRAGSLSSRPAARAPSFACSR